MEILKQGKVNRCKDSMKCDQNNLKTIIGVQLMILFLRVLLFIFLFFFYFYQNHLIVTSDVIICTGYTIFANTLNL